MPIRLGKSMRQVLAAMAYKQLRSIRVNFLIDELTTRERKAIRQLARAWAKDHLPIPNMTTGPESTPLRPWTAEQVESYRRMRLTTAAHGDSEISGAHTEISAPGEWDGFFFGGPTVSEDFDK